VGVDWQTPEIVTVCVTGTTLVVTEKVALVPPYGIVTLVTIAAEFELFRSTTIPVEGATALMVTIPVTALGEPPTTEVGETLNELTWYGFTERAAD
jgi:hypothetical protein